MSPSFLRNSPRCRAFAGALLLIAVPLQAQTTRAGGGGARAATTSRGGNTRSVGGSSASLNSSASGPRQYRSNTLLGDATIQIDPETRSLVIVTDEATHEELMKVIHTLDQPKPQVLIKVVFVEVTYNKGYDVGVEGTYLFNQSNAVPATGGGSSTTQVVTTAPGTTTTNGSTATGAGTTTTNTTTNTANGLTTSQGATTNPGARTTTGNTTTTGTGTTTTATNVITNAATTAIAAGATDLLSAGSSFGLAQLAAAGADGAFVRLLTNDWNATLRLLATRGKVEVLSRPSIMARNNQEAVIVVGQEVPLITNSRTDTLGNLTNTIAYENVGIILRVTPFITSDGTVEMIVAPEISSLNTAQQVPIASNVFAPTIDKRSAETVVVTPNGATVVIGGLMQTQRIESVRKIPVLGDIPYLGVAFRRTTRDDVKRELLIFLTPTIVNSPASLKRVTDDERNRAELVDKAFSATELANYFEPPSLFPEPPMPDDNKEIRRAVLVEKTRTTKTTTTTAAPVKSTSAKPKP